MKTNFLFLYALIFLEAGFIYYSYMDTLGIVGTIFPSAFYVLIALVDIYSTSRKYAILVLLTTIGIAFPRVLIKIEDLNEKVLNKQIVEIKAKNPEFSPILQDCNLLVQWDLEGRNSCMKSNKLQMEKANEHNFKITSDTQTVLQNAKIGAKEYAEIILFAIISICLPLAIFILLYDTKTLTMQNLPSGEDKRDIEIQQQNVHITNAIYTPVAFQESKAENTVNQEAVKLIEREAKVEPISPPIEINPISGFFLTQGIEFDQRFLLSGITYDYYLKQYNLLVDVFENSAFPPFAKACLAKKRLSYTLGYSYLILSPLCVNSLSTFFASKIPQYSILLEDYRSASFLHSISVQLSTKEISELTLIPSSSIYRKLSR